MPAQVGFQGALSGAAALFVEDWSSWSYPVHQTTPIVSFTGLDLGRGPFLCVYRALGGGVPELGVCRQREGRWRCWKSLEAAQDLIASGGPWAKTRIASQEGGPRAW